MPQFALTPGGCSPIVVIRDAETTEGEAAVITVRVEQLPAAGLPGTVNFQYRVLDGTGPAPAEIGEDVQAGANLQGSRNINLQSVQQDPETGLFFASTTFQVNTLDDNDLEPPETFLVEIEQIVSTSGSTVLLGDDLAKVTILNDDELDLQAPGVPFGVRVFYDFQTSTGAFERSPDSQNSDLPATDLTFLPSGPSTAVGLVDATPTGPVQGCAARSGSLLTNTFVDPPLYEFEILPDRPDEDNIVHFIPTRVQFWDNPIPGEAWQVEVEVPGFPAERFTAVEIYTITEDAFPLADPRLVGWRRMEARIDLQGPPLFVPTSAVDGASGYAGPISFRVIPTTNVEELAGSRQDGTIATVPFNRRRVIDNLSVFGPSINTVQDELLGLQIEIEDLLYGQVSVDITEGPGIVSAIVTDVDPGGTNPRGQQFLSIVVQGTDVTSVVNVVAQNPDGGSPDAALNLGHVVFEDPVGTFNTSAAGNTAGSFEFQGGVDNVYVNSVADGSSFDIAGERQDRLRFIARGDVGGGLRGVDLSFDGEVTVDVRSWQGGQWNVGSADHILTRSGDFSPRVEMTGGFARLEVKGGNLASPRLRTGVGDKDNGSSGVILVFSDRQGNGGSVLSGLIQIDGNLDSVRTQGGSFQSSLIAGRVGSVTSTTDANSTRPAQIAGQIEVTSIDVVSVAGGDITATVVTHDARHTSLSMWARPDAEGRGGRIDSPLSFHIAGGVKEISAQQIRMNLNAGGTVQSIVATAAGKTDATAGLEGRLAASRFGEIVVTSGAADFTVRATSTHLDGQPGVESIRVPTIEFVADRIVVNDPGGSRFGEILDVDQEPLPSGDLDGDRQVGARDLALLCRGIQSRDVGFDLNGDRLVNADDLNLMIEDILKTTFGDANLDRVFNTRDLVQVLIAGQYEDRVRGNSTWETGDWTCDGEFDSQDIVKALQAGGYSYAASQVQALPVPSVPLRPLSNGTAPPQDATDQPAYSSPEIAAALAGTGAGVRNPLGEARYEPARVMDSEVTPATRRPSLSDRKLQTAVSVAPQGTRREHLHDQLLATADQDDWLLDDRLEKLTQTSIDNRSIAEQQDTHLTEELWVV